MVAMSSPRRNRRHLLGSALGAAAAAALWPRAVLGQAAPRIVIVGGGFAGACCARALRNANSRLAITLVEKRRVYMAPPLSNAVLGGLRHLSDQQFTYDRIAAAGIEIAVATATGVDVQAQTVTLSTGDKLSYDRLVLAPGIDLRFVALPGYSESTAAELPHAWTADSGQIELLRRQIEAMDDGGLVAITAPVNPARCPPGPYERASMIAYYLKNNKPRSKLVIIDAKDEFTMQSLFQNAWHTLYPGLIEWVPPSKGGDIASIDAAKRTIDTDFDTYKFAVANIIPPQQAAAITMRAGVTDRTGWCPIDAVSFESLQQKNIHVIGDAAIAGAMPKSAFSGAIEGKLCAAALVRLLAGETPVPSRLDSNCYSVIAPDYAISLTAAFQPASGEYAEIEGSGSATPLDAPPALHRRLARSADTWFRAITSEIFS